MRLDQRYERFFNSGESVVLIQMEFGHSKTFKEPFETTNQTLANSRHSIEYNRTSQGRAQDISLPKTDGKDEKKVVDEDVEMEGC